ncbi:hypothetical protein GCM10009641_27770 [Mycobacterium cookii]|uniref:Uncharacterized protein n=1 Tax=Nocardioides furvisabuli TaxID=375542 RepID=A0ABN2XID5_9ACTN
MDTRIAKAKAAPSSAVKTVVWVMKPGPMALVAIRNIAPSIVPRTAVPDVVPCPTVRRSRGRVSSVMSRPSVSVPGLGIGVRSVLRHASVKDCSTIRQYPLSDSLRS